MNSNILKILIIEDEALIAEGLSCCIKNLGHTVVGIHDNGLDALDQIQKEEMDCILIDINLPEMDGIQIVRRINEIKDIPCIFITGYSDYETILRASNAGAYGYLTKPVDEADLDAVIRVAFLRHQERKNLDDKVALMRQEVFASRKMIEERKLIEKAKGILAEKFNFSENDAMKFLRKKSRDNNRKIIDIAREIIKIEKIIDI